VQEKWGETSLWGEKKKGRRVLFDDIRTAPLSRKKRIDRWGKEYEIVAKKPFRLIPPRGRPGAH